MKHCLTMLVIRAPMIRSGILSMNCLRHCLWHGWLRRRGLHRDDDIDTGLAFVHGTAEHAWETNTNRNDPGDSSDKPVTRFIEVAVGYDTRSGRLDDQRLVGGGRYRLPHIWGRGPRRNIRRRRRRGCGCRRERRNRFNNLPCLKLGTAELVLQVLLRKGQQILPVNPILGK